MTHYTKRIPLLWGFLLALIPVQFSEFLSYYTLLSKVTLKIIKNPITIKNNGTNKT